MKQQLAQLRRLGRLLGAAVSLMGVFWVAYFVLANAFAGANAEQATDKPTESYIVPWVNGVPDEKQVTGADKRVTADVTYKASQYGNYVMAQDETYTEEFPSTVNDYLGAAQRFAVFANNASYTNNLLGNIAAGKIVSSGNDIRTESAFQPYLVKAMVPMLAGAMFITINISPMDQRFHSSVTKRK